MDVFERDSSQEEKLVRILKEKGWTISTAESCTGGLIGAAIVNVSGASEVFEQGFITYSDNAKQKLLGVNSATLDFHTAVSSETAGEMAMGAARAAGSQVALASTGIAGPGGGTPDKPVGLVYLACYMCGRVTVQKCLFSGNRSEIREQAVRGALELALKCIL